MLPFLRTVALWRIAVIVGLLHIIAPQKVDAASISMPLDGSWVILDDGMAVGVNPFFTGAGYDGTPTSGATSLVGATTWLWSSSSLVRFDITDYFVATDWFNVYDNGALVATITNGIDWQSIPGCNGDPMDAATCHWASTPDIGFADPLLAHASLLFAPGSHAIAFENLHVPAAPSGAPFNDGTVAFRAEPVPEPASLFLVGAGLIGAARSFRRKRD